MDIANNVYWNTRTYGSAVRFRKGVLRSVFVFLCLVTPATNWMIPFVNKIIKSDLIFRY